MRGMPTTLTDDTGDDRLTELRRTSRRTVSVAPIEALLFD